MAAVAVRRVVFVSCQPRAPLAHENGIVTKITQNTSQGSFETVVKGELNLQDDAKLALYDEAAALSPSDFILDAQEYIKTGDQCLGGTAKYFDAHASVTIGVTVKGPSVTVNRAVVGNDAHGKENNAGAANETKDKKGKGRRPTKPWMGACKANIKTFIAQEESRYVQSATCKRGERKARFERARECLRLKAKLVCASKPGAFDCDDPEFDNYLNKQLSKHNAVDKTTGERKWEMPDPKLDIQKFWETGDPTSEMLELEKTANAIHMGHMSTASTRSSSFEDPGTTTVVKCSRPSAPDEAATTSMGHLGIFSKSELAQHKAEADWRRAEALKRKKLLKAASADAEPAGEIAEELETTKGSGKGPSSKAAGRKGGNQKRNQDNAPCLAAATAKKPRSSKIAQKAQTTRKSARGKMPAKAEGPPSEAEYDSAGDSSSEDDNADDNAE